MHFYSSISLNKAPGQSFDGALEVDMSDECLFQDQLYVTLSQIIHPFNVVTFLDGHDKMTTNILYNFVVLTNFLIGFAVVFHWKCFCRFIFSIYYTPKKKSYIYLKRSGPYLN